MSTFLERELLAMSIRRLRSDGYDVVAEPPENLLPSELSGLRLDAVAFGKDGNIILEVLTNAAKNQERVEKISELISELDGWSLRIIWSEDHEKAIEEAVVGIEKINARAEEALQAVENKHFSSAFLLMWAIFEAFSRLVEPEELRRPQSSISLVEKLAGYGYVTPDEADILRSLAKKRNELAHGQLNTDIALVDLKSITNIFKSVLEVVKDEVAADMTLISSYLDSLSKLDN